MRILNLGIKEHCNRRKQSVAEQHTCVALEQACALGSGVVREIAQGLQIVAAGYLFVKKFESTQNIITKCQKTFSVNAAKSNITSSRVANYTCDKLYGRLGSKRPRVLS